MKEKINARLFALKYTLMKKLNESLEKDKQKIKEGAEIVFKDYCGITITECERNTFDKNEIQKICEKYNIDINKIQKTSKYTKVNINNIPQKTINRVENIFNLLSNTEDNITATFADKMLEE